MILAKSSLEARANRTHRVHADGHETWVWRFFTASAERPDVPVAFLVEQKAQTIVPPHFHEVPQFQVIVAGHGTLGKQEVWPLTLHYTNAYTGYGPLGAAEEGMAFFTLRNQFDAGGARYFPAGRSFMKPTPKRHRVSGHLAPSDATALRSQQNATLDTVLAPEADGLAAWLLRAVPGTSTPTPPPEQGGGQYIIVAGGSLLHDGMAFPRLSCIYVSCDEGPLALQASPEGLEVLILHFPRPTAAPPTRWDSDNRLR
jgi:hypothetical protein